MDGRDRSYRGAVRLPAGRHAFRPGGGLSRAPPAGPGNAWIAPQTPHLRSGLVRADQAAAPFSRCSTTGSGPVCSTPSCWVALVSATYRSLSPRSDSVRMPFGSATITRSNSRPFASRTVSTETPSRRSSPLSPGVVVAVARCTATTTPGDSGEDLRDGVSVLTVRDAKGLEFDRVIVADPNGILTESDRGLNDLYVALTRATQQLGVLHTGPLPVVLHRLKGAAA